MTVHNYRSRQVHETLNGVNPSSGLRDMRSAKSGPNLYQIWQVFGQWASLYGANGQMTMTVHKYRPRQFHRTSNGENPSSGYRDMGSASLAAARPAARPPARTVTTIPLQPGGLRGKKCIPYIIGLQTAMHYINCCGHASWQELWCYFCQLNYTFYGMNVWHDGMSLIIRPPICVFRSIKDRKIFLFR